MVSLGKATRIAGGNESTVANWSARYPDVFEAKWFGGLGDPSRRGLPASVNRLGIIFLTIMVRLTTLGLPPGDAAEAAKRFALNGDQAGKWPKIGRSYSARRPGELWIEGRTFLFVTLAQPGEQFGIPLQRPANKKNAKTDGPYCARLMPVVDGSEFVEGVFFEGRSVCAIVNVSEIVQRVDAFLPRDGE